MSRKQMANAIHYSSAVWRCREFRGRYRPMHEIRLREKGSIEQWFTSAIAFNTTYEQSGLSRGNHHLPWPLQDAEAS